MSFAPWAVMTTSDIERSTPAELAGGLRVLRARALRWPNVWCLSQVIIAQLRTGRLSGVPPLSIEGVAALAREMPEIVRNQSRDDCHWGELVARLALELQRRCGADVSYAHSVRFGDSNRCTIVVGYEEELH